MTQVATVEGLYVGAAAQRWPDKPPSAIAKAAVSGPLLLGPEGFAEDAHADTAVHGGPEKALHWYPAEHYAHWLAEAPDPENRFAPGGFGENLSTHGVVEQSVCLGDVFRIGDAEVQISLGRQPCWKLDAHTGVADMAYRFRTSGRTGWYCRVRRTGAVALGDPIVLLERPRPDWPLARVIAARFDPRLAAEAAAALASLPELGEPWRTGFAERARA